MAVYDIEEGVRYACQRCGNCCRWRGEVAVDEDEIDRIAAFLGMPVGEFVERHTGLRADRRGLTLLELEDGTCSFLDGIDCAIQPVKPRQCAGFPNQWNFPGWRKVCEAVPVRDGGTG
jgi:Fe-S-cluster containining protein